MATNSKNNSKDDDQSPALPKENIEERIKEAVIKVLKLPREGLHDAKITIKKDAGKIIAVIKTDAHKLRHDLSNLIHHKHIIRQDALGDQEDGKTPKKLMFEIPSAFQEAFKPVADAQGAHGDNIQQALDDMERKIKSIDKTLANTKNQQNAQK